MYTTPIGLLGMLLLTGVLWAEEPCFCLRDAHDNWMKGCQDKPYGVAQQLTTFCDDPVSGGMKRLETTKGWTRVLDKADGCTPCKDTRP